MAVVKKSPFVPAPASTHYRAQTCSPQGGMASEGKQRFTASTFGVVDPLDSGFVFPRFDRPVGTGDPNCDDADQNAAAVDPLDAGFVLARFGDCGQQAVEEVDLRHLGSRIPPSGSTQLRIYGRRGAPGAPGLLSDGLWQHGGGPIWRFATNPGKRDRAPSGPRSSGRCRGRLEGRLGGGTVRQQRRGFRIEKTRCGGPWSGRRRG